MAALRLDQGSVDLPAVICRWFLKAWQKARLRWHSRLLIVALSRLRTARLSWTLPGILDRESLIRLVRVVWLTGRWVVRLASGGIQIGAAGLKCHIWFLFLIWYTYSLILVQKAKILEFSFFPKTYFYPHLKKSIYICLFVCLRIFNLNTKDEIDFRMWREETFFTLVFTWFGPLKFENGAEGWPPKTSDIFGSNRKIIYERYNSIFFS